MTTMRLTTLRRRLASGGAAVALALGLAACGGDEAAGTPTGQEDAEVGAGEAGVDANTGAGGGDDPFAPEDDAVEPGDADNVTEQDDLVDEPEREVDEPAGLEDDDAAGG